MIKIFLFFLTAYFALYLLNPIYAEPFLERPFATQCVFSGTIKSKDVDNQSFIVEKLSPYKKSNIEKKYFFHDIEVNSHSLGIPQTLYGSSGIKSRFGNKMGIIPQRENEFDKIMESKKINGLYPPCRGNLFFELVPYIRFILILLILSYGIDYLYKNRKKNKK